MPHKKKDTHASEDSHAERRDLEPTEAAHGTEEAVESPESVEAAPEPTGETEKPSEAAADSSVEAQAEDIRAALEAENAQLRAKIEELESQLKLAQNQYLRTLADFQNFRRRSEEQSREIQQFANRELILGLLPILDNFERAFLAAQSNQNYEALVAGVELTMRQMQEYLRKNGVEPIEAVGKEFDPNYHEAVMRVEGTEHPENTVVDELQRGYMMHERVLRPSMVRVARDA